MTRHVPLVQKVHPMLPNGGHGGQDETVCAQCNELWPCRVNVLEDLVKALEEKTDAQGMLLVSYRTGNNRTADSALTKMEKAVKHCASAYEAVANLSIEDLR